MLVEGDMGEWADYKNVGGGAGRGGGKAGLSEE